MRRKPLLWPHILSRASQALWRLAVGVKVALIDQPVAAVLRCCEASSTAVVLDRASGNPQDRRRLLSCQHTSVLHDSTAIGPLNCGPFLTRHLDTDHPVNLAEPNRIDRRGPKHIPYLYAVTAGVDFDNLSGIKERAMLKIYDRPNRQKFVHIRVSLAIDMIIRPRDYNVKRVYA